MPSGSSHGFYYTRSYGALGVAMETGGRPRPSDEQTAMHLGCEQLISEGRRQSKWRTIFFSFHQEVGMAKVGTGWPFGMSSQCPGHTHCVR
jgi:hypothetical protein